MGGKRTGRFQAAKPLKQSFSPSCLIVDDHGREVHLAKKIGEMNQLDRDDLIVSSCRAVVEKKS